MNHHQVVATRVCCLKNDSTVTEHNLKTLGFLQYQLSNKVHCSSNTNVQIVWQKQEKPIECNFFSHRLYKSDGSMIVA